MFDAKDSNCTILEVLGAILVPTLAFSDTTTDYPRHSKNRIALFQCS